MNVDTEARLQQFGMALLDATEPVTIEMILAQRHTGGLSGASADQPATHTRLTIAQRRRLEHRRTRVLALAAAALLLVAGLFAILGRPGSNNVPAKGGSSSAEGALAFPSTPARWILTETQIVHLDPEARFVDRVYTASVQQPADAPALVVTAVKAADGAIQLPSTVAPVTVQGVPASEYPTPGGGRTVTFERDGYWYSITADGLSEADLRTAAEHATRASGGDGAIIQPAGLPGAVVERATGQRWEAWFVDRRALSYSIPSARWTNGDKSLWSMSLQQDPTLAELQRLFTETASPAVVHGRAAQILTTADDPVFRSIVWTESNRTYFVGSRNLTNDELITDANALQPATPTEWARMLAATNPTPEGNPTTPTPSTAQGPSGTPSVFDSGANVVIFIRPGAASQQIQLIQDQASNAVSSFGTLERVEYLDSEQAMAEARRVSGREPPDSFAAFPGITPESTPTVLRIWVKQTADGQPLHSLALTLLQLPNVLAAETSDVAPGGAGFPLFDPGPAPGTTLAPLSTP